MCGRYSLSEPVQEIAARFLVDIAHLGIVVPRANIAPSEPLLAIRSGDALRREACWLRWGLAPPWAGPGTPRPINARAETASQRPMFAEALRARRALLPADGFYEWRRVGGGKQPVRFGLADGGLFALAAIWERRRTPAGLEETACILTTSANTLVAPVHDRMPVILRPRDEARWLDPGLTTDALAALLAPFPADAMAATDVNGGLLRRRPATRPLWEQADH